MQFAPRPSRNVLQAAAELGRIFGTVELRIQPDLKEAHQYSTYLLFITAHRHQLELLPEFAPWEAKLQELIEQEGDRCALQAANLRDWDPLYTQIGMPIRCAFWYAWEMVHNLQKKYQERMQEYALSRGQVGILSVAKRQEQEEESDSPGSPEKTMPPFAVAEEAIPRRTWQVRAMG